MPEHHNFLRAGLEIGALTIIAGSFTDYLPAVASALSIAWYLFSFYKAWKGKEPLE